MFPVCSTRRGMVGNVPRQSGLPIAWTAPLARITDALSAIVHRFAGNHDRFWSRDNATTGGCTSNCSSDCYPVYRHGQRPGQPLLLLLHGRRSDPVLTVVVRLFSGQADASTATSGPNARPAY